MASGDQRDWDAHFLTHANLAATMSTCRTRQVGAVAVRERRILGTGFNGNAPGARHCDEGGCLRCADSTVSGRDLAMCLCVHAEANVVAYAARNGVRLEGATVYCTTQPCAECTKLLAVAGVIRAMYTEPYAGAWSFSHPTLEVVQYAR